MTSTEKVSEGPTSDPALEQQGTEVTPAAPVEPVTKSDTPVRKKGPPKPVVG